MVKYGWALIIISTYQLPQHNHRTIVYPNLLNTAIQLNPVKLEADPNLIEKG